ncbi:MAG: ABC transporter substrate-binding protein [Ilumatobacter sp.]|nr:ABC transporter substrate-binding protein [Ilumatobacter sp.]
MTRPRPFAVLAAASLVIAACGDDGAAEPDAVTPTTTEDGTAGDDSTGETPESSIEVVAGEPFPEARCEANRAAGTISYLSGFDFAATASIIDVLVADERGLYGDLCLDVDIAPSFSTANYPLVSANDAQFSSSGSFSELASFAAVNEADLVALAVEGRVAIDSLMVKPGFGGLEELNGTTIGVKGKLPPSIAAMLAEIGLIEGEDFDTLLLEGFDPIAHWEVEGISAVPGWKSNEPGTLERNGVDFDLYDPAELGIPGSFGLVYTNRTFLDEHPTAAEDFMRATMRGLAEAIADPAAAAELAVERINGNGNPNFLSPEGETFRWATDAQLIVDTTPAGSFPGVPDSEALAAEIAAYDAVGVYGDAGAPAVDGRFDPDLLAGLYADDGTVIWPGS